MAKYTYDISPIDVYGTEIGVSGETRAAELEGRGQYYFRKDTDWPTSTEGYLTKDITFVFNETKDWPYGKKRVVGRLLNLYFTYKRTEDSGWNLPSGNDFYYPVMVNRGNVHQTFSFHAFDLSSPYVTNRVESIALNAYNQIDLSASHNEILGARNFDALIVPAVARTRNTMYYDRTYGGDVQIKALGILSATNKPYVTLQLDDVVPYVENCFPTSGFLDETMNNVFGWDFAYDPTNVEEAIGYKTSLFRWRKAGTTTIYEIPSDSTRLTIPANTFPNVDIEWQVVVTSDDNINSQPDSWFTLSATDSISSALPISPVDSIILSEIDNYFSWSHIIATGTKQTAFDLQYRTLGTDTWINLYSGIGSTTGHLVPANTFAVGNIQWRVRTYNTDDVVGEWSSPASVVVRGLPQAPSISGYNNNPRPTISWQSPEQQAFEVKLGDWESGVVFGTDKEYKIPFYLTSGNHTISIRITNEYGEKSDWARVTIPISNVYGSEIVLKTRAKEHAILTWSGIGKIFYIYRDGVLIGKTDSDTFTDYLATGKHSYQIRAVDENDNYGLSNEVIEIAIPNCAMMAEIGAYDWVLLRYTQAGASYKESELISVTYTHHSGRRLPMASTVEFEDSTANFSYRFKDVETYNKAKALKGKLVVWKNKDTVHIGILNEVSGDKKKRYDMEFSITACELEAVAYE